MARVGVRFETARPDIRLYLLTSAVLLANLALFVAPLVIGLLALFGAVR